ncbi:MAG: hypothetical protein A2Z97_00535 [Bdellovibrionales bacterium GWB1_52_6]|nr:MAG: hypothetical protein A2Z97_00535 [Bdellovibrionales bacterium GWB1_52_6]OFZ03252.1 MAG: hypothetical protein A2X97_10025 [Bdellovibrionales bacterium GWA1_52_35]HCM40563.1 hypothetical protein [Bdellovibrionales bacterium]
MSSVSPSDGGYQYYQRTVTELEDELAKEVRRAREREESGAARLEQNYKDELAKRDRDLEDTVNSIKKNSDRYVASERANARAEVDELKAKTYDRNGRYNSEASALARQLAEQERAHETVEDRNRTRMNEAQEDSSRRTEELHKEYEGKLEKAVTDTRKSILESTGKTSEERNHENENTRLEIQKRYDKMDRERIEEVNMQRRRFEAAYGETERDQEHRTKGLLETSQKMLQTRRDDDQKRIERDTKRLTESHENETKLLRSQVSLLADQGKDYVKGKAEGVSEAVKQYEDDWRDRVKMTANAYENEISSLKDQAKKSDIYFNHLNTESLRDKDAYFAKLLARQGLESHQREKSLENTFNKDREQIEKKLSEERSQSKKQLNAELKDADRLRATALENQAKTYQEQMQRQRVNNNEKLDKLESSLKGIQTSSDASDISPAAESAVRKSINSEYEKNFNEERERNKRSTESIRQEYSSRVRDALEQGEAVKTRLTRAHASENNLERMQFLDHVTDVLEDKNSAVNAKEADSRRQADLAQKNVAQYIEKQRREFEEIARTQKEESSTRLMSVQQQANFNMKMAQRAFAAKQNEIVREYDKKLTDQKREYDDRLDEMKSQSHQAVRDADRRNKLALDEQQRMFDQRLSQLEVQHKERERYITENYQEDLEKVKRSNALLIQKKS